MLTSSYAPRISGWHIWISLFCEMGESETWWLTFTGSLRAQMKTGTLMVWREILIQRMACKKRVKMEDHAHFGGGKTPGWVKPLSKGPAVTTPYGLGLYKINGWRGIWTWALQILVWRSNRGTTLAYNVVWTKNTMLPSEATIELPVKRCWNSIILWRLGGW